MLVLPNGMKLTRTVAERALSLLLLFGVLLAPALQAQVRIQVKGLKGVATYGAPTSPTTLPLQKGAEVPVGAVVRTGSGSAIDLAFSHNAGTVRLLQNSTLSIDKFTAAEPPGAVEIQLNLLDGTMAGFDKKLSGASKYQIRVSRGIADIGGSKYRINAQGYLVLLDGTALFVFVPPSGEPVPFELKAPPPVYFSPLEGVRPAPDQLVREVVLQSKGQLRGR